MRTLTKLSIHSLAALVIVTLSFFFAMFEATMKEYAVPTVYAVITLLFGALISLILLRNAKQYEITFMLKNIALVLCFGLSSAYMLMKLIAFTLSGKCPLLMVWDEFVGLIATGILLVYLFIKVAKQYVDDVKTVTLKATIIVTLIFDFVLLVALFLLRIAG